MNKKLLLMTLIGLVFSGAALCQNALPAVNPNAERDRMYHIVNASAAVELPAYVSVKLKNFAKAKGYNEPAVLRNTILLKPLFNKNLSKDDRLFAGRILMRMCDEPNTAIPADLVTETIKEISKN